MTFKKVWFGLGSRNGLSFLVADFFFPECILNLFRELFMASERHLRLWEAHFVLPYIQTSMQ